MNYVIIDIQGLRGSENEFVLKELAVLSSNEDIKHFIVKSPYSQEYLSTKIKYTNKWLYKNHHGFNWLDGEIALSNVIAFLKKFTDDNIVIYVKGDEKKTWLSKILNKQRILDLDKQDSTSLKILKNQRKIDLNRCSFNHKGMCAAENVYILKSLL